MAFVLYLLGALFVLAGFLVGAGAGRTIVHDSISVDLFVGGVIVIGLAAIVGAINRLRLTVGSRDE